MPRANRHENTYFGTKHIEYQADNLVQPQPNPFFEKGILQWGHNSYTTRIALDRMQRSIGSLKLPLNQKLRFSILRPLGAESAQVSSPWGEG